MTTVLTATELAEKIGCNERTVRRALTAGEIPDAQKKGRIWIIPADTTWTPKPRGGARAGAGRPAASKK